MFFPKLDFLPRKQSLLFLLAIIFLPLVQYAQTDETQKKTSNYQEWEAGIFLGGVSMLGDLVPADNAASFTVRPAFGLSVYRNLSEVLALRANLFFGQVESDDADSDSAGARSRGFSHETPLTELSLMLQYEFLGARRYGGKGAFRKTISPYVFLGVGGAFGSADVNFNNQEANPIYASRIALDEEDATSARLSIPVGLGLKIDLSRKLVLAIEGGLRPTFDDFLDGVSESANPDQNDWYGFGGVTLNFRLGEKDSDKDGIADVDDNCPQVPGNVELKGCPDTDNDGIADKDDNCPNEYGAKTLNGCPDSDSDGIADINDDCPNDAGKRRFQGCPDSDDDDVIDKEDVCPNVPGLAKFSGCPDTDNDGIVDNEDKCPNEAGPNSTGGCPDADGDGVLDSEDNCPNKAGTVAMGGCPDSDGDGIADDKDKCPTLAGSTSQDGCPTIAEEDKKTLDEAMRNVRFETSSAKLRNDSKAIMRQVAEVVKRYPGYKLTISGYTDSVGNDVFNQGLSERRARSCYNFLIEEGVPASIMSYAGYGETNPISTNDTAAGRRLNRRVEFSLIR